MLNKTAGYISLVDGRVHIPEVEGSNPSPAILSHKPDLIDWMKEIVKHQDRQNILKLCSNMVSEEENEPKTETAD
jgi:hypothetical protein